MDVRKLMVLLLGAAMLGFVTMGPIPEVEAQKGSSSGSSSGSKPSTSSPPASSGSKPGGSSSGPTFSGGSSSSSGSKPGASSPPASSGTKPGGSSSGPTFSGGGASSKPGGTNGPTFSGGTKSGAPTTGPPSGSSSGSKPGGNGFDSKASQAQAKAESKAAMKKAEAPKTEYKTAGGTTKAIDPKSKQVESLRNDMSHEKYTTRTVRHETVYHNYYGRPPMIYNDPYGPLFMYILLDRSLDDRAAWAYHHRQDMDDARYAELLKRDAALEAKVRKLEADKVARDPSYSLPGVDPDLQYDDDYVDAVYNPQEEPGASIFGWWCILVPFAIVVILGIIYIVFIKEWK